MTNYIYYFFVDCSGVRKFHYFNATLAVKTYTSNDFFEIANMKNGIFYDCKCKFMVKEGYRVHLKFKEFFLRRRKCFSFS